MDNNLKLCFLGLGSIGQRHIRNAAVVLNNMNIDFSITAVRRKESKQLPEDVSALIDETVFSYDELEDDYDAIFITNPTYLHFEALRSVQNKSKAFFVEKPVFSSSAFNVAELDLDKKICYVACPLRHTRLFKYIHKSIDISDVISVRAVSSSYLPEWRKGSDYRKSYSASKEMGGGVSLDVIHEWDYLTALFGFPNEVFSIIDKVSDLDIDSDDVAIYIGKGEKMTFELHLDYYSKETIRHFLFTTNNLVFKADYIEKTLSIMPEGTVLHFDEDPNSPYLAEMNYFFDILLKGIENINSIDNAYKVLKLAEG